jgi:hypothetical protein
VKSASTLNSNGLHNHIDEIRSLLRYVALWNGTEEAAERLAPRHQDPWFQEYVAGNDVLIYGPGPTGAALPTKARESLVAQVLMPGVTRWEATDDLADGRANIVYANGETDSWLMSIEPE